MTLQFQIFFQTPENNQLPLPANAKTHPPHHARIPHHNQDESRTLMPREPSETNSEQSHCHRQNAGYNGGQIQVFSSGDNQINKLNEEVERNKRLARCKIEWQLIAMVVDRLLLWSLIIVTLCAGIGIYLFRID